MLGDKLLSKTGEVETREALAGAEGKCSPARYACAPTSGPGPALIHAHRSRGPVLLRALVPAGACPRTLRYTHPKRTATRPACARATSVGFAGRLGGAARRRLRGLRQAEKAPSGTTEARTRTAPTVPLLREKCGAQLRKTLTRPCSAAPSRPSCPRCTRRHARRDLRQPDRNSTVRSCLTPRRRLLSLHAGWQGAADRLRQLRPGFGRLLRVPQ